MLSFGPVLLLSGDDYKKSLIKNDFTTKSCEYSFANIIAWSDIYNTTYSEILSGFVFAFDYNGEKYFLCPTVKDKDLKDAYNILYEYAKNSGFKKLNFVCLPEKQTELLKEAFPEVKVSEKRDGFDYIYNFSSLSEFSGKSLHSKKNHKNKFFSLYKDLYRFKKMTKDDVSLCHAFNQKWYELNKMFSLDEERLSTEKLLDNFEKLELFGGLVFVGETLCGYSLASENFSGSDTIVIHTEKALYEYNGIYPTLCSEFLLNLEKKYDYVNREDDVGDEGLRKSKLSYKPCFLEKKFDATIDI